ncbi:hypothetical protein LDVICp076 [lymphocystis disease virus-China]|uniref:Uncharacterized protein n=1 Tax=lymphocystis disease virus-China TaxID=256729 RepID=Q678D5_9VIRU|nr:hypothetical protein LDVICp076 [lymphocystis disease virus-China]AAU10922.1 hypothetical protein [lymphocystis disease virus-China]
MMYFIDDNKIIVISSTNLKVVPFIYLFSKSFKRFKFIKSFG